MNRHRSSSGPLARADALPTGHRFRHPWPVPRGRERRSHSVPEWKMTRNASRVERESSTGGSGRPGGVRGRGKTVCA